MGRAPCCDKTMELKRGPWSTDEDEKLLEYIKNNGHGCWRTVPKNAGLLRCGKSCRLRWANYLRPDIKRGPFSHEEEKLVIQLHGILGNRWASIASQLPGRTDNEVKNLWNTHLRKRLIALGLDPQTHEPATNGLMAIAPPTPSARHMAQWESARLEAEARLSRESFFSSVPFSSRMLSGSDHIMRMWNSEVGEAFRSFKKSKKNSGSCGSHASGSGTTTEAVCKFKPDMDADYKPGLPGLDSGSSSELEDSDESTLQLLLDFPGSNDMSFLGNTDNYLMYQ